jgi:hypothetical protein
MISSNIIIIYRDASSYIQSDTFLTGADSHLHLQHLALDAFPDDSVKNRPMRIPHNKMVSCCYGFSYAFSR